VHLSLLGDNGKLSRAQRLYWAPQQLIEVEAAEKIGVDQGRGSAVGASRRLDALDRSFAAKHDSGGR
jgi:hypothetical protein